jgi:hypothetical protein
MSGGSFDAIITNGMASIRGAAEATGRSVAGLRSGMEQLGNTGSKEFSKIGAAISKMGGPVADLGGKFFGAAGMEGGIARLAVAAALLGIAFKAIGAAMDASKARTEALIAATGKLEDAYRSAAKAKDDFASGSADTGRTKAAAENLFGPRAGDVAENIAKEFKVELGDVLKAMAATGGIPREQRMAALRAAAGVAATGEATTAEAIGRLGDRATRERVLGQRKRTIAGLPVSDERARSAVLLQTMRGGNGEGAWNEAVQAIGGPQGSSGDQLAANAAAGSITTRGQVAAYDSGGTALARTQAAVDAVDPTTAALKKFGEEQAREIEKASQRSTRPSGQSRRVQRQPGGEVVGDDPYGHQRVERAQAGERDRNRRRPRHRRQLTWQPHVSTPRPSSAGVGGCTRRSAASPRCSRAPASTARRG